MTRIQTGQFISPQAYHQLRRAYWHQKNQDRASLDVSVALSLTIQPSSSIVIQFRRLPWISNFLLPSILLPSIISKSQNLLLSLTPQSLWKQQVLQRDIPVTWIPYRIYKKFLSFLIYAHILTQRFIFVSSIDFYKNNSHHIHVTYSSYIFILL